MYVPSQFAETDEARLVEAIEQHSFATVVTVDAQQPFASHLPLLLDKENGRPTCLVGHMARANPQWQAADGRLLLAIFHGPHAYISPTWYEAKNVVPTWNYVAVHVYGTFRLDDSRHRRMEIVRRYVDYYEAHLDLPWSMDQADTEFIDKLVGGIVGFRIDIERMEGKFKLNQNHDPARRARVISALRAAGGDNRRQIADLMAARLNDEA